MNIIMGEGIAVCGRKVVVDGVEYPFLKKMRGNNITTVNGKVYVNGFELVGGEWKRTLKAFYYMVF